MNSETFFERLKSRKFVLALLGAATFLVLRQYPEAVATILGYFGINVADKHVTGRKK